MKNKTLYISDLDGTLLNSDKELSRYTLDTLNALMEKGLNFTVATARSSASAIKILEDLKLKLPVILMNGVAIYDLQQHKYIKTEVIQGQTASSIICILKEHDISGFMYAISKDTLITYYENLNSKDMQDFYDERVLKYNKTFEQVESFLNKTLDNEIIYFSLIGEYERLAKVLKDLSKLEDIDSVLYRDIYGVNLWYLEIHSINASKYNSTKYLREYCEFDRIIGFGDNLNDLPLFRACDQFYAVSNAVLELKEKATNIIGDNNSDGVARFISDLRLY